jgi:aspartate/methionine/tyrosine aminotransferase
LRYDVFEMERWQSTFEHRVRFNLSESGVHPMSVTELLELAEVPVEELLSVRLGYGQSNGSDLLRERIAALYQGASEANVLVTVGGAEANFTALWHLLTPGEGAAVMLPNYMQVPGLLTSLGGHVEPFHLLESEGWQPDLDELELRLKSGAGFILVTNPNNPTGSVLSEASRDGIIALADRFGAWILSDEVYTGAEVEEGTETPSFWDRYDRVIATNSLSKAYGLPGLRLGWLMAPSDILESLWGRTDYTTIAPASLSDTLAAVALSNGPRGRILDRTRSIIRRNLPVLEAWMARQEGRFTYRRPDAGAICYVRYHVDVDSLELAEVLRTEQDLLIVPGAHFGMDRYFRIGFGPSGTELTEALGRLETSLDGFEDRA